MHRCPCGHAPAPASPQVLPLIRAGDLRFVLHQQQYAQGYFLTLFLIQGVVSGGWLQQPLVDTGPVVVDRGQVERFVCIPDLCPPEDDTQAYVRIVIAAAAGVTCAALGAAAVLYLRWRRTAYAPRDAAEPYVAMFVALKHEGDLWDQHEAAMDQVTKTSADIVARAARRHKCYQVPPPPPTDCHVVPTGGGGGVPRGSGVCRAVRPGGGRF